MNTTAFSMISLTKRWAAHAFTGVLALLLLAPVTAYAQDGPDAEKTEQLKQAYGAFQQAAKQDNYDEAYTQLERAIKLAEEAKQSGALKQLQSRQQKLPTMWGNKALKAEDYEGALQHFQKGVQYSPQDPYVYYGRGLALVNMDSTEAALESMKQAVDVGNETGNTRVAQTAEERIRQEFVSAASKALSKSSPSTADADRALTALDDMRNYVDANAKSLFYRARALQVKGDHEDAIQTAQQGLEMHQGSRSDAAKYHFIIAESQMSSGAVASACTTFQDATYGDYKARAEHYLENECSGN